MTSGKRSYDAVLRLRRWRSRAYGQRRRFATFAAGALALAVGYHVVFGHNGLNAYEQKRQDTNVLAVQLRTLSRENEEMKAHVERLQSDPTSIEHQAREELHYTRPGEVIVTLQTNSVPDASERSAETKQP